MQYSPLALAFLGDSVYEEKIREMLILSANMPANALHKLAVKRVCAEYQAAVVHMWEESNFLSEQETDVYKRGRNTKGINAPKHSSVAEYRCATGLEALFGFLRLTGKEERIDELFKSAWNYGGDINEL